MVDADLSINPDGDSGDLDHGRRLDFGIETSQKSYQTFTLEATNAGGHSSEPRSDNAIYELAQALVRLSNFQFPFKTNATTRLYFQQTATLETGQKRRDLLAVARLPLDRVAAERLAHDVSRNALLHSTCVATMLSGGHQENALPQRATATVQCRVMPEETVAMTRATLVRVIADPHIAVTPLGTPLTTPESPVDAPLFAAVTKVTHSLWPGVLVVPEMSAGASDSLYTRLAGIPSYGISGGWEEMDDVRAHGRDERREIGAFYQSVEFTYRLMKELGALPPRGANP